MTISRNEWKSIADLELDLQPDLPPVDCVIDEINQVVLNMIVNSAQAIAQAQDTGNGSGKGRIAIGTKSGEDFVQISISDTGAGIPRSNMHRIFDPFFTTKEVGKGTGQGMAIAHDIREHSSRIVSGDRDDFHCPSAAQEGTCCTWVRKCRQWMTANSSLREPQSLAT
ncbi:MAG: ATP-binding protein [Thermacetogeniaceae bacterium]